MTNEARTTGTKALGFTFTEVMAGHVGEAASDFKTGARNGKRAGTSFWFRGTVVIPDLAAFLRDPQHRGELRGTAGGTLLDARELPFSDGEIALFAPGRAGRLEMRYRFALDTPRGRLHVDGFKDVHNDYVVDFWPDTTRLYTRITSGGAGGAEGAAGEWQGLLTITPAKLVPQVMSFRGVGVRRPWQHPLAITRFLWFFTSTLLREYRPRLRRRSPGAAG
jgi:hypothetical protein